MGGFQKQPTPLSRHLPHRLALILSSHPSIFKALSHMRPMLGRCNIIPQDTADAIVDGLTIIQAEIAAGDFEWSVGLEDVHMNIEAALTEKSAISEKPCTRGRSRNDQVATDVRLYLRHHIDLILAQIRTLQQGLLDLAGGAYRHYYAGVFTHPSSCTTGCFCASPHGVVCHAGPGMPSGSSIAVAGSMFCPLVRPRSLAPAFDRP